MAADAGPRTTLFGLEVTDDAGYTQYRCAMEQILARHGGALGCDFVVARNPDAGFPSAPACAGQTSE